MLWLVGDCIGLPISSTNKSQVTFLGDKDLMPSLIGGNRYYLSPTNFPVMLQPCQRRCGQRADTQDKGVFVPLLQDFIAAASMLESWIGLDLQAYTCHDGYKILSHSTEKGFSTQHPEYSYYLYHRRQSLLVTEKYLATWCVLPRSEKCNFS